MRVYVPDVAEGNAALCSAQLAKTDADRGTDGGETGLGDGGGGGGGGGGAGGGGAGGATGGGGTRLCKTDTISRSSAMLRRMS